MSSMLRLFIGALLVLSAVLAIAIGMAEHTSALTAPAHLILFILALWIYFVPTAIALHRNCNATGWIIAVNTLLGWSVLGWIVALGWAAVGKKRGPTSMAAHQASH